MHNRVPNGRQQRAIYFPLSACISQSLLSPSEARAATTIIPNPKIKVVYEVKDEKTGTTLIAVQPLVADQTYMSQMKAMCVPFHMVYGRLMCY